MTQIIILELGIVLKVIGQSSGGFQQKSCSSSKTSVSEPRNEPILAQFSISLSTENIFKGYRNETLGRNGLMSGTHSKINNQKLTTKT